MTKDIQAAPAATPPSSGASADGLAAAMQAALKGEAGASDQRPLPPIHLWNPDFCGDIDMRIARDGTWFYQGSPIGRAPLVKLFSSILKREGDAYFLVTPAEKVGITVEDAPLHAIDMIAQGAGQAQILEFSTRTEDHVTVDLAHPLRFEIDADTGAPSPYVLVRGGASDGRGDALWARIDRKTFFRMVDLGCHETKDGDSWFGLWSSGQFFPVIKSSELD